MFRSALFVASVSQLSQAQSNLRGTARKLTQSNCQEWQNCKDCTSHTDQNNAGCVWADGKKCIPNTDVSDFTFPNMHFAPERCGSDDRFDADEVYKVYLQLAHLANADDADLIDTCLNDSSEFDDFKVVQDMKEVKTFFGKDAKGNQYPNVAFAGVINNDGTDTIVVSVAGTKTWQQLYQEIIHNKRVPCEVDGQKCGNIMTYFHDNFHALWDPSGEDETLAKYVQGLCKSHGGAPISFTGHSLGAAVASIGALTVALDSQFDCGHVELYTFGQPRTGDMQFSYMVEKNLHKVFRVVKDWDLVPRVPFCGSACNSKSESRSLEEESVDSELGAGQVYGNFHHGTQVWYENSMNDQKDFKICPLADGGADKVDTDGKNECSSKISATQILAKTLMDHTFPDEQHVWYFNTYMGTRKCCPKNSYRISSMKEDFCTSCKVGDTSTFNMARTTCDEGCQGENCSCTFQCIDGYTTEDGEKTQKVACSGSQWNPKPCIAQSS